MENRPRKSRDFWSLTPRERDVLNWVVIGKRNAEIATILHCQARTVQKHVENILQKMGVETRLAAARSTREKLAQLKTHS